VQRTSPAALICAVDFGPAGDFGYWNPDKQPQNTNQPFLDDEVAGQVANDCAGSGRGAGAGRACRARLVASCCWSWSWLSINLAALGRAFIAICLAWGGGGA
jgi:hypothetical protein